MGLKVISLMKQVPLTSQMRMGADGLMDRTKVKSIINVDCCFGLEQGLQIKRSVADVELIVVSMGPPSFEQSLRQAVSLGYDRAVLLSDRRLGGSDTFSTGMAIAKLLQSQILSQNPDDKFIVFAGRQTSDGDTAHVPSQVAENLSIPQVTFAVSIDYSPTHLVVKRMIEGGYQTLKVPMPCVISVAPTAIHMRRSTLAGAIKSRKVQIQTYTLDQIGVDPAQVGLNGSPTSVAKVVNIVHNRPAVTMVDGCNTDDISSHLVKLLDATETLHAVSKGRSEASAAAVPEAPKQDKYPRADFRNGASGIFTWAEVHGSELVRSSVEILNPARKLADELKTKVTTLLIGHNVKGLAARLIALGADEVIVVDEPRLKEYSILPFTSVIEQIVRERRPEIALFGATTSGRELAPRLGSRLGSGVTADCTILKVGEYVNNFSKTIWAPCLEAIRPTYGESKLATIVGFRCPQMATARPGTFERLKADNTRQGKITEFSPVLNDSVFCVEILGIDRKEGGDQGLFTADVIIAGGRPCGEIDDFKLIKELVAALEEKGINAAWGATRQAVDHGYAPYSRQIGQTGKTVRPKVYIAVAVSGAIQHVSGMKESGKIIAINQDQHSNIYSCADYGIVGQYQEMLPALIKKVRSGFTFGLKAVK